MKWSVKEEPLHPIWEVAVLLLHAHARGHPEGGGNGGQHGNDDVQDFAPKFFFHELLNDS